VKCDTILKLTLILIDFNLFLCKKMLNKDIAFILASHAVDNPKDEV